MKRKVALAWLAAGCLTAAMPVLCAQAQNSNAQRQQTPQGNAPQQSAPQSQPNGNPFPEDVKSVPLMPSANTPDVEDAAADANSPDAAPPRDSDPVRSPEDLGLTENGTTGAFSSSSTGLDNLISAPDTDTAGTKGKKGGAVDVIPHETAEKDIDVGNYYMANKNWRGALSRFQSALVLAPENPDVYWGLAECYRHVGQFADARKNYEWVAEYDPDSKHGKEAQKTLKEPDLANAVAVPAPK